MGRYTGPACRLCRREGMKLFLKGDRCYMAKCPIETGRPPPGMHGGGMRRGKQSDYGTQLREKQKLKRIYGLQEGQFRLFFERAAKRRGVTGEALLQQLELRLDNLVYRFGFAASRRGARQAVRHRRIAVNGRCVNVPSTQIKPGSRISLRKAEVKKELIEATVDAAISRGTAPWLSFDREKLVGEVVRIPTRDEIAPIVNEQLVVELYSK
ncbi:MAG: 30S ribosomal protein S4 [Lentisphaerales bacterium]|jgi:small subunit ribosomal protein S4|nr:MAG: 30S ribosomal protein S4 [Lentisphaerales bacterium]